MPEPIGEIIRRVMLELQVVPVGISNRHIHLAAADFEKLFGKGTALQKHKDLIQPGEFAAVQTVSIVGPKGKINGVRILGPLRNFSQVEISRTDGYLLGINPPLRNSGQITGTPGITIVGYQGQIELKQGVVCAARHLHMNPAEASFWGLIDGDVISVAGGERQIVFKNVLVRVHPNFRLELHLDCDEANAAGVYNGDCLKVIL